MRRPWYIGWADFLLFYHLVLFSLPVSQFVYHTHHGSELSHKHQVASVDAPMVFSEQRAGQANWHMHEGRDLFVSVLFALLVVGLARFVAWRRLVQPCFYHFFFAHRQSGRSPPCVPA